MNYENSSLLRPYHTLHLEELDLGNISPPLLIGLKERNPLICLDENEIQTNFSAMRSRDGKAYLISGHRVMAPTKVPKVVGSLEVWSAVRPDFRSIFNRELNGSCVSFNPKKFNHTIYQENVNN